MVCTTFPSAFVQPPSGGCELKLGYRAAHREPLAQPPSGGCELKPIDANLSVEVVTQPPSGGCELKQDLESHEFIYPDPAAFGRL